MARVLAWSVHAYTAMGLVVAAAVADLLLGDSPTKFRDAFILMLIAIIIDATDGTFARRFRVKEVVPGFDGRRLDDIVDFLNYTFLPLLLIYEAGLLPDGQHYWLLAPLLASAYGFCQVSAKTDDGFFLGFPSYWNLVAFYLYVLGLPGYVSVGLLIFFALMTFVPLRYLYPTQPGRLNRVMNVTGAVWGCCIVVVLWQWPDDAFISPFYRKVAVASLIYPLFYLAASWLVSWRYWLAGRREAENDETPADSASV